MTLAIRAEPLTAQTGTVLTLLFPAAADAYDGADVLKLVSEIEGTGVLDRNDDSTGGIRVTPLPAAVDSDEAVVKVVRPIVYRCDVTDYDSPRSVDIHIPKRFDDECRQPVPVEGRVHPVFLGNVKDAVAGLNDAGGHHGRVHILDDAGRLLWGWRGRNRVGSEQDESTNDRWQKG
jgi:hypothetical protein